MDTPGNSFRAEYPVRAAHHRRLAPRGIVEKGADATSDSSLQGLRRVRLSSARRCLSYMGRYGGVRAHDQPEPALVRALAWAFPWRRITETVRYGTSDELAAVETINLSYVSRLLRLTLLAPDIVEAILDGLQPAGMTLPGPMKPFSSGWELQHPACGI